MAETGRDITLEDVEKLLGRALVDSKFRSELMNNGATVFAVLGLRMSADSKNFFAALTDQTFLAAANSVENRLGNRGVVGAWL